MLQDIASRKKYSGFEKCRRYMLHLHKITIKSALKFILFCTAVMFFCVLMYKPLYHKATYEMLKDYGPLSSTGAGGLLYTRGPGLQSKKPLDRSTPVRLFEKDSKVVSGVEASVDGWPSNENRDTRIYVKPNIVTTIHEPKHVCSHHTKSKKNNLFLLIIVCSSTSNFDERMVIRETWGHYKNYLISKKIFDNITLKYKNYKYDYDLYTEKEEGKYNVTKNKSKNNGFGNLPELNKALQKTLPKEDYDGNTNPDFKLVFLLGLPPQDNDTEIQSKIEEEVQVYDDVIQEGFIDSYTNLTLKSIMMLKWVTNKCKESVRYIFKTDDDMYVNVPNLMLRLRNLSQEYKAKVKIGYNYKKYVLIGNILDYSRRVVNINHVNYSPKYMFDGAVYPKYLSGWGYAMSAPTARVLYSAALRTRYFHLEDVFITGLCTSRGRPPITALHSDHFAYRDGIGACGAHIQVSAHLSDMRGLQRMLTNPQQVDRCERMRLTIERQNGLKSLMKLLYQISNGHDYDASAYGLT